jgi:hypothetical protein
MTTAVDKRQPQQTRGDNSSGCDLAIDWVADKKWQQTREMVVAGKR